MQRNAIVYVRISQDREGGGLGVARQEKECRALVKRLGWRVVAVESDNDISAYSGKARPGYRRMLAALDAGRADAVVAWHTDRLHRSNRELIDYIDAAARLNFPTETVVAGKLDLATATGRATAITLGAWARRESEDKAERIVAAHRQSADLGKWRGGTRPFGYEADAITLHPVESGMVRAATTDVIEGRPLADIIREWNASGVTSTTGKPWGYATLRQVLLRARNYGASIYRGEVRKADAWPAIVDESTWRSARAVLSDPKRRLSTSNQGRWLLAGLARCGKCAAEGRVSVMRSGTSQVRGVKWPIYKCQTGMHLARRADLCDEFVSESVIVRLGLPEARELLAARDTPGVDKRALQGEARGLRAQLDEAAGLYAEGVLTAVQLRATTERLRDRLGEVEGQMIDPARSAALAAMLSSGNIRAYWDADTWKGRREVLNTLVAVTILPIPAGLPRRFSPDHVQIEWRA